MERSDESIPNHQLDSEMVKVVLKRSPVAFTRPLGIGADQNATTEQRHADVLGFVLSRVCTEFASFRLTQHNLKCTIKQIVFNIRSFNEFAER